MSVRPDPDSSPLTRIEKVGLVLFGLFVVAFGGLVMLRSAFQNERKTDFGCYARAAHAVRVGNDIYHKDTCDDRGWHYAYPPAFAILMVPLADPFVWDDRTGYLPWWASIAIWYALSIAFLAYSVHALANVVLPDAVRGSRRWWYARTVPVYVCLAGVGATLSRGQVNLLLVALLVAMFVAAMRGRLFASGAWLAAAITLKVIPAIIVLYPFARRDWRAGVGLAVGLFVLLFALPASVWGVKGTRETYERFVDRVLLPGSLGGGDQTRARELTDVTATDSQSFQAMLHNWQHPDRAARPDKPSRATKLAHWGLVGLMVLTSLVVAWRRLRPEPAEQLVFFGSISTLMMLATPVSHLHYYALVLPLVAGLWLRGLALRPGAVSAGGTLVAVLVAWGVLTALPMLPYEPTKWFKDMGLGVLATVGLWSYAVVLLCQSAREAAALVRDESELPVVPGWEHVSSKQRPAA